MAQASAQTVDNAIKIVGEVVLAPGISRFIDGDIKDGSLHAAAGLLVRGLVGGPIGFFGSLLVAANSYSRSTTGQSLPQQFGYGKAASSTEAADAPKTDDAKPKTAKA